MAVRIEHKRSIVGWAVMFPYAGNAIIPSACRKSCSMKPVHGLAGIDFEGYVKRTWGRFARVNVKHCAPFQSEAYGLFTFVNQWKSQRLEYLLIEVLAPRKILHTKTYMGELHDSDGSMILVLRNQSAVQTVSIQRPS